MELKHWMSMEVDVSTILTARLREYNQLQKNGKLNVVDLVMHIENIDAYQAIERCLEVLKDLGEKYPVYKEKYERLHSLHQAHRPPMPWKMEQFYKRLEKKLLRLEKEKFFVREVVEWERYYTAESTVKRWLKRLQDWGYVMLVKKDKLTGYQYKLRFKNKVDKLEG